MSMTGPRVAAIVVAGGSGTRFGELKQFLELDGQSVAERSVEACRAVADFVVIVVPAGSQASHGADAVVVGGPTRAASVRAGLGVVSEEYEVIVVHDAARPLASEKLFSTAVAAVSNEAIDGAICAMPVVDTIKRVAGIDGRRRVIESLNRSELVAVQTPQAFRAAALRSAHATGAEATDDAALVENNGGIVMVVAGDPNNLKLTSPVDLRMAQAILEAR